MTRDDAISKVHDAIYDCEITGPLLVDALAALGVLKLDEPNLPMQRLALSLGWPANGRSHAELCRALDEAGLRIVEADTEAGS